MNSDRRQQIRNEMRLRETDNLLDIWQDNNRVEWSDEAFEVIREILLQRGVDIPPQDEPNETDDDLEDYFSEEELAIIDDDNPPVFYDPFEVLRLTKQLDWMVKAIIILIVAYNIFDFSASYATARASLFSMYGLFDPLVFLVAVVIAALKILMGAITVYVPLKVLVHILRILMEMEFRSRKAM